MYLGVDLGTSGIKLLLANENGKIIDSASSSYVDKVFNGNWSEQEPQDWWKGFCISLEKLKKTHDLKKLKGISFSGQMHGLVILDENDKVIRPAILWNDGRTTEEVKYLNETIGKENLLEWTGNIALTGFTAPKILWVKNNEPQNFQKIKKIMLSKDYLVYRLTKVFASDVSDNSGTLYFDVKNKVWSNKMLDTLEISENMLPKIYESAKVIGTIDKDIANLLELSSTTQVVIGGGDQAMGAIGTGTVNDGQISIQLGTSGVIFINSREFAKQESGELHSFCNANGEYHLMGVTLSCAGSTKWWVEDILNTTNYDEVLCGISDLNIDDLLFLPYLMGERSPINNPFAKGGFMNITALTSQKKMTKAVVEGICFSLKDCLNSAEKAGAKISYARVIGGGTKSNDWLQILSDVLNIELKTINTSEGGSLGAIILAMTATGKFACIEEGCRTLVKEEKTFTPNEEKAKQYKEKFSKFKELYLKNV